MNNISKIDFAQEFKILLTNSEENKPTLQCIRPTPIKPKRNLMLLIRKYGIRKLIMRVLDKIYPISELIIYLCSSNKQLVTNKSLEKYYNKLKSQRFPSFGYIYFPLHFEPELSTIPLGFPFSNQFQALEMLASELEKRDIPIIVKEHPRAYENKRKYLRSKKIYDDLLKYNNVYLIDKDITSKKIIDNSLAVATITGTSGWEAFLQRKPVMAFGSIFYTSAPGVFKIKNVIDLENCLNKILKGDILITRNDQLNFIKELDKYSFNAYVGNNFNESIPFTREESDENTLNALDDHLEKRQYTKNIS